MSFTAYATSPLSRALFIPALVSAFICAAVGVWYGWIALATVLLLVILEVTLSFDNAVVNAKVLEKMSPVWRHRFLTWGIIIAVFLTRAVLPIVIVALSAWASPLVIAQLALFDAPRYAELLEHAEYIIGAFGSMFLLMAGFHYFFDTEKRRHWIQPIERHLVTWGSIDAIEIVIALVLLAVIAASIPLHTAEILLAGIVGIVLFAIVQGVAKMFSDTASMGSGLALFAYLNVLDAAFSLDSVVGAFALSKEIVIIVIGLGIGAYFVRSLTIYMVENGTLGELVYLEHGAHWAILGLAGAMIANMFVHIPDPITGFIGLLFVGSAYVSSIRIVDDPVHVSH
jgi:hypothetical protein